MSASGLDAICRTLTLDFARRSNILRNVLGLLSNISEVSALRGALMSNGLVEHLMQILGSGDVRFTGCFSAAAFFFFPRLSP